MTKSLAVAKLGIELPQIVHAPANIADLSAAEDAIELANSYAICDGSPLSPSQELRLRNGMGQRADGLWAAKHVGDFGGRQGAGKTDTVNARELAGIFLLGEQLIIHTAHEFPTASEAFLRMMAILEAWDDLRGKVKRIMRAHGDQGFEFLGGQRLLYKARTGKSGRGFAKAALVVYDEAQEAKPEHLAGSGPAKLANPNSQSWYAGSGGLEHSTVAWDMRRRALTHTDDRLAYTEHTAEDIEIVDGKISTNPPDPLDRDAWAKANPGLGRWVDEEGMAALYDELGPVLFLRECLCVWEPEPSMAPGAIDFERWTALIDADSKPEKETVRISLDIPPERTSATFAIAGKRADGLAHVSVLYHVPPHEMGHVVAMAKNLCEVHDTKLILPPGAPVKAHKTEMEQGGVPIDELTAAEYAEACGLMASKVREGTIRHRGIPEMMAAVQGLGIRRTGDIEIWARRVSTSNISPFVAATAALVRVAVRVDVFDGEYFLDADEYGDIE